MIRLNFDLRKFYMEIGFHFQTPVTLCDRKMLRLFIQDMFRKEGKDFMVLDIVFCSDDYLLGLNQGFLQHDTLTDIITFDLSDPEIGRGEIYISVERVKENAFVFGVSMEKELHRVIFHGICHLCGYKDKSPADKLLMRSRENYYLDRYFVSRGT